MYSENAKIKYKEFKVEKVLGNGASARVYRVGLNGKTSALKVFDPAIFSGDAEAKERLDRQEKLIGVEHDDLASIFEIGEASIDDVPAPALLMEFCVGHSLEKLKFQEELTEADIRTIIAATARAAKHLFELGFVHRDIKPANIVFDPEQKRTKLLDTGVIRPLNNPNDVSGFAFVGTTRYSPPEFLYRTEDGSPDCWKAITFYQLGITLYELIFRRQPYHDIQVKAQLIKAIEKEAPSFAGIEQFSPDIRNLLICSLKRNWQLRVKTLNWDNFLELETVKLALNCVKECDLAHLTMPISETPISRQDELERLLTYISDETRDFVLNEGALIRIQRSNLQVIISVGKSDKNLTVVVTLTFTVGFNDTFLVSLTTHNPQSTTDHYLLAMADREQISSLLKTQVIMSV